jgi:uncharacterized protein YggU (UPF0235/DUF167 family)
MRAGIRAERMSKSNARLSLKVIPGSSRDCIAGWLEETLKVHVRVSPERGKANTAVEKLVAHALDMSPNAVRIVSGMTSARKTAEISGLSLEEIHKRLARVC